MQESLRDCSLFHITLKHQIFTQDDESLQVSYLSSAFTPGGVEHHHVRGKSAESAPIRL